MYKSDNGIWRTKSLFYEHVIPADMERHKPIYTTREEDREEDGVTYRSLYKLFMTCADEYDFANKYLGGMGHLEALLKSNWFTEGWAGHRGWNAWLEDMRARDESNAKSLLIQAMYDGDVTAAKKIFDASKKKPETKRGRFIKEEAVKEAAKKSEDKEFLDSAVARLNVVNIHDN